MTSSPPCCDACRTKSAAVSTFNPASSIMKSETLLPSMSPAMMVLSLMVPRGFS